jgi:hypothetical protein
VKLHRNHPFLLLGLFTIVVGGLYHRLGIDQSTASGVALHGAVSALGFIFINMIRVTSRLIPNFAIAGLVSSLVGLVPYLLADWLLRRRRARTPRVTGTA